MGYKARKDLYFQEDWRSWGNARRKIIVEGSAYIADLPHDEQARVEQVANLDASLWVRKEESSSEQVVLNASHWSSWNGDGIVPSFILVRSRRKQENRR